MSDLLSNLGDMLNHQFMTGENKNRVAQLGNFANKYDRTAQRQYTEQGYFRNHFSDNVVKQLDIISQEPSATILVKKKAFSSLAENFRTDLMDRQETLFLLATKTLFANKCRQISAYEKLTKLAQVSTQIGEIDYHLLPILFSAVDTLDSLGVGLNEKFKSAINQVRQLMAFGDEKYITTWHTFPGPTNGFGQGTGTIEFTNFLNFNTNVGLNFGQGGGNFSISFSDPYNLMKIKNNDIEDAINSAGNKLYNNKGFQLLDQAGKDTIDLQKKQFDLARKSRGANPIRFIIEPGTFIGKRVRAIVDSSGIEIIFDGSSIGNIIHSADEVVDPTFIIENEQYNQEYGQDGLTKSEARLFNNIVSAMYNQLSLNDNSRRKIQSNNESFNIVRKKLRLYYANKLVIQPMDTINFFINSKKRLDSKITGGLQTKNTGLNFMQGLGNLVQNIKDSFGTFDNKSIEKSIFVGSDFPVPLWLALRDKFVSNKQGACVFTGIVENASSNYSDGKYIVNVSGGDNSKYFEYGIVNIKPSLDVYNGTLYDPLTPFDLKYDSVSGVGSSELNEKNPELLKENKEIFKSAFVKYGNGPLAGAVPTEQGYFSRNNTNKNYGVESVNNRKPFYDIEGMVYRWKEGIASLIADGSSHDPYVKRGNNFIGDPFAGQNIMNILSLLVTGEPYDYATYYKAATIYDSLARDSLTNEISAASYFRGLRADLKNRNAIYGNFLPFKSLTVDEAGFDKLISSQLNATKFDGQLQTLTEERASLADQMLSQIEGTKKQDFNEKIKKIDEEINLQIKSINNELNRSGKPAFKFIGNDISYDYTDFNGTNVVPTAKNRKELRRKLKFLTKRLAWKTRANQDNNLFIVDDLYDKDYDIQAYEQTFADPGIFKSEYTTVAQQVQSASEKLKLEIFCNTQGHIEIRDPKYNRVPSSVFYKMIKQKDETGVQVFPQFLQDLFITQIKDIYQTIEVYEDQIRLYCIVLDKTNDTDAEQFINSTGTKTTNAFKFLSDRNTGYLLQDFPTLIAKSDPEFIDNINNIQTQLSSQIITSGELFSTIGRANIIKSSTNINGSSLKSVEQMRSLISSDKEFDNIKIRLSQKLGGQIFNLNQEFGLTNESSVALGKGNLATLKITNNIAVALLAREKAIKVAVDAVRNLQEGLSLNSKNGSNKLLFPSLFTNSKKNDNIPQIFEYMIEDESYDDLGSGSSERYILKNRDIIDYEISEHKPSFTSVRVRGNLDPNIPNATLPSDLSGQSGNLMTTAEAVDYDLWRMYGISIPQDIDALFLHNPRTQMAPYAVSILTKARKEVLQGRVQIIGNEFQQPGEVVYIENEDLLFYVERVSHSFTYGGNFRTTVELSHGHNPGEYIPTPLDIIGKILYKNNLIITEFDHRRQGNVFNQENLGAIAVNLNGSTELDVFNNSFKEVNKNVLDEVSRQAQTILSMSSSEVEPILELRIYYNDQVSSVNSINSTLASYAKEIKNYLIGSESSIPISLTKQNITKLGPPDRIRNIEVNSNKEIKGEYRYPSRKAFWLAKSISKKVGIKDLNQVDIDLNINSNIIDFWIVFENKKIKE